MYFVQIIPLWTNFGLFRSFLAKFRSDFFISGYSQYILNTLSRNSHDTLRNYTLRILTLHSQYILKVLSWYSQELCSKDINLTFWMYSQVVLKFLFVILQYFWTYQIFLAAVFGIETPGEKNTGFSWSCLHCLPKHKVHFCTNRKFD